MNINKFLRPLLPAVMAFSTGMFIAGCNSSNDDPAFVPEPVVPPVPPENSITGIWEGVFIKDTPLEQFEYKVTVLFHMPDDPRVEGRGNSGGIAFGDGPTNDFLTERPHFLFEGGYAYSAEPVDALNPLKDEVLISCDADVWALGRSGTQGTFVQEFSYDLGSAAGPAQRGAGCLYLRDANDDGYVNELIGEINFEEAGKLQVALTYSEDNDRDTSVSDLVGTGTDDIKYHLWSNDNSGTAMNYTSGATTADTIEIVTVESNPTLLACGADVKITQVEKNLFTLETMEPDHVTGCTGSEEPVYPLVNFAHFGLGAFIDVDDDDKAEFVHMMSSRSGDDPDSAAATALYNQFIIQ